MVHTFQLSILKLRHDPFSGHAVFQSMIVHAPTITDRKSVSVYDIIIWMFYLAVFSCYHREVSFKLQLATDIDSFDEGVEFGIQNYSSREWIPVMFYASQYSRSNQTYVGEMDTSSNTVNIRGYNVQFILISGGEDDAELKNLTIKLCSDSSTILENVEFLSFRWIQTVVQTNTTDNLVFLDDIQIKSVDPSQISHELLMDDFNNQASIR